MTGLPTYEAYSQKCHRSTRFHKLLSTSFGRGAGSASGSACAPPREPTCDEVAQRVKAFSEGRVSGEDFFASEKERCSGGGAGASGAGAGGSGGGNGSLYSEPFYSVADPRVLSLIFGLLWVAIADVRYNVLSSFRMQNGLFMIEAEVTYTFRAPFYLTQRTATVHFYNTVAIKQRASPSAACSWKVSAMETIRESYKLSIPARIVTTPVIHLLSIVFELSNYMPSVRLAKHFV